MAKILLHIGSPKTASTTLQEVFFPVLHTRGVINYLKNKGSYYLRNIFRKKDFFTNIKIYQEEFNNLLDNKKINVISDEGYFGDRKILHLKQLFQNHSVEVFVVLRKQDDFLYSHYVQAYCSSWYYTQYNSIGRFYSFITKNKKWQFPTHTNYSKVLTEYKSVFKKIHCLFYEELVNDESSYYKKIAKILETKLITNDIPKKAYNVKLKCKEGYITIGRRKPVANISQQKHPMRYNIRVIKLISIIDNSTIFCFKIIYRIFFKYNIFYSNKTKQNKTKQNKTKQNKTKTGQHCSNTRNFFIFL